VIHNKQRESNHVFDEPNRFKGTPNTVEHGEKSQNPAIKKMPAKSGPKPREFPNDKATNEWLNAQCFHEVAR